MDSIMGVAGRQHGVIHRAQALGLGLSHDVIRGKLERGEWRRACNRVYVVAGAPDTWTQRLFVALLWAGRGAAISHEGAAALHRFPRYWRDAVVVSYPKNVRCPRRFEGHRCRVLDPRDVMPLAGLRVTNPARTLIDLSRDASLQDLRSSLDYCLSREVVVPWRMEEAIVRLGHGRDITALVELYEQRAGGEAPTESELEALLFDLLEDHALPKPAKQHVVPGRRSYRLDFAYLREQVMIETDGRSHIERQQTWEKDLARRNALQLAGWFPLFYTWKRLKDDEERVVDEITRALRQRSVARAL